MKKFSVLLACFLMVGAASARKGADDVLNIFEFNRMAAVVPPFTGNANLSAGLAVRALPGRSPLRKPS